MPSQYLSGSPERRHSGLGYWLRRFDGFVLLALVIGVFLVLWLAIDWPWWLSMILAWLAIGAAAGAAGMKR